MRGSRSPPGISGTPRVPQAQGGHLVTLRASVGPQGREEVALSLGCLASLTKDDKVTFTPSLAVRRGGIFQAEKVMIITAWRPWKAVGFLLIEGSVSLETV